MKKHLEPLRTAGVKNWSKRLRRYGAPTIQVKTPDRYLNSQAMKQEHPHGLR